jgi:hypothetical protein
MNFIQIEICGTDGLICLNNGVCSLSPVDHISPICICSPGFAGDDCSAIICGSEGNACYNGGYCNETTGMCICPPPLTSDDCRGSKYILSKIGNIDFIFRRYLW